MRSCITALLFLLCTVPLARAQEADSNAVTGVYSLGQGLLCFNLGLLNWTDSVPVYRDTGLSQLQTVLTAEQTDCPECMGCAEPATFFPGSFHPLFCGGGKGPAFICTRTTAGYHEIIMDTLGTRVYVPWQYGNYRSWEQYLLQEAAAGEYMRFVRQWDSTILYDQPYPIEALPAPDSHLQVKLALKDVDDLLFYPVAVQGYWMKLKARRGKQFKGYCWIIWRNENQLLHWFAWRAD